MVSVEYLAGYFDGEGTIVITKTMYRSKKHGEQPYYSLRIQVASTTPVSLREFEQVFGGYVQFHSLSGRERRSPRWDWCACSHEARAALERMLPHLLVKRSDAEIGIAFQRLMTSGRQGRPVTQEMRQEREASRLRLIGAHGIAGRSSFIVGRRTRPTGLVESTHRRKQARIVPFGAQEG